MKKILCHKFNVNKKNKLSAKVSNFLIKYTVLVKLTPWKTNSQQTEVWRNARWLRSWFASKGKSTSSPKKPRNNEKCFVETLNFSGFFVFMNLKLSAKIKVRKIQKFPRKFSWKSSKNVCQIELNKEKEREISWCFGDFEWSCLLPSVMRYHA